MSSVSDLTSRRVTALSLLVALAGVIGVAAVFVPLWKSTVGSRSYYDMWGARIIWTSVLPQPLLVLVAGVVAWAWPRYAAWCFGLAVGAALPATLVYGNTFLHGVLDTTTKAWWMLSLPMLVATLLGVAGLVVTRDNVRGSIAENEDWGDTVPPEAG